MNRILVAASAVVIAAGLGAAWKHSQRPPAPPREVSDFAMWDLRAGAEFAPLRASIDNRQLAGWQCAPLVEKYEYCVVKSEGPPTTPVTGVLRVITDSARLITAIQFSPVVEHGLGGHKEQIAEQWATEVERIEEDWDRFDLSPDYSTGFWQHSEVGGWSSDNGRWAGRMVFLPDGVRLIGIIDHGSLAQLAERNPGLAWALAEASFETATDPDAAAAAVGYLMLKQAAAAAGSEP